MHSAAYTISFLWGLLVFLSFLGWGTVLGGLCYPERKTDMGQRAAWGVAFSAFVGGGLNLAGLISKATVVAYIAVGAGFYLWSCRGGCKRLRSFLGKIAREFRCRPWAWIAALGLCLVLGVRYAGEVSNGRYSTVSDFPGYFVFPEKMLETGSLGPDPFSGRRLVSSLGAQSFLDTLILCVRSEPNLNLMDAGLGLMISCALFLGLLAEYRVSRWAGLVLFGGMLSVVPPPGNISSIMMGMALYLSLFRTLEYSGWGPRARGGHVLVLSLVIAGACSLKSNLIPACALLVLARYALSLGGARSPGKVLGELCLIAVVALGMMLPWMISLHASSGTLLYPIFGQGFYGTVVAPPRGEVTLAKFSGYLRTGLFDNIYFIMLIVVGAYNLSRIRWGSSASQASLAAMLGAGLGAVSILFAADGIVRLAFPVLVPAAFGVLVICASRARGFRLAGLKGEVRGVLVLALIWLYAANARPAFKWGRNELRNIRFGLAGKVLVTPEEVRRYRELQRHIPEGATVLSFVPKPFLFDFAANRIYIVDVPGTSSLPPGLPFYKGEKAVVNYLLSKSIRYVAVARFSSDPLVRKMQREKTKPAAGSWIARLRRHRLDLLGNLGKLGKNGKRLYDDGEMMLIDLAAAG